MVARQLDEVLGRVLGDAWSPARADDGRPLVAMGVDSLKMVELVLELEAGYGVVIPDECLVAENFATVGSVEAMMRALSRGGGA